MAGGSIRWGGVLCTAFFAAGNHGALLFIAERRPIDDFIDMAEATGTDAGLLIQCA